MAVIFDLPVTSTSERIPTSPTVSPPRKCGNSRKNLALLSFIQAEIYLMVYLILPANGSHLWFTTNPDVREYSHRINSHHWLHLTTYITKVITMLVSCYWISCYGLYRTTRLQDRNGSRTLSVDRDSARRDSLTRHWDTYYAITLRYKIGYYILSQSPPISRDEGC